MLAPLTPPVTSAPSIRGTDVLLHRRLSWESLLKWQKPDWRLMIRAAGWASVLWAREKKGGALREESQ